MRFLRYILICIHIILPLSVFGQNVVSDSLSTHKSYTFLNERQIGPDTYQRLYMCNDTISSLVTDTIAILGNTVIITIPSNCYKLEVYDKNNNFSNNSFFYINTNNQAIIEITHNYTHFKNCTVTKTLSIDNKPFFISGFYQDDTLQKKYYSSFYVYTPFYFVISLYNVIEEQSLDELINVFFNINIQVSQIKSS